MPPRGGAHPRAMRALQRHIDKRRFIKNWSRSMIIFRSSARK
jgi:hypothetical protein